jgi:hypothetical protein
VVEDGNHFNVLPVDVTGRFLAQAAVYLVAMIGPGRQQTRGAKSFRERLLPEGARVDLRGGAMVNGDFLNAHLMHNACTLHARGLPGGPKG